MPWCLMSLEFKDSREGRAASASACVATISLSDADGDCDSCYLASYGNFT